MDSEATEIEIVIEYDSFIAGRELSEILEVVDEALWYVIAEMEPFELRMLPPYYGHYYTYYQPPPSLFCISESREGSVILTAILGGAAAKYCYDRFRRGFRRARIGPEIEHFGHAVAKNLERILKIINHRLDQYTADAKEDHSRIKKIHAHSKNQPQKKQ